MSKAEINDIEIYYDVYGEGEPLLMIQGLGYSSEFWFKQIPAISEKFKVIVFDNRDVGRSDKVEEDYTIGDMAEDVVGLLDFIGIESANVLGVSMGGLIAQELTLNHPNIVRKLILMDTHPGGPEYLEATEDLWQEISDVEGLSVEEAYRKGIKYAMTNEFFEKRDDIVNKLIQLKMERPQPAQAFQRQFKAASKFDRDSLDQIKTPTLVIHGGKDQIVPLDFGKKILKKIADAELHKVEDAGHLTFIEKSEEVNQVVLEFLEN